MRDDQAVGKQHRQHHGRLTLRQGNKSARPVARSAVLQCLKKLLPRAIQPEHLRVGREGFQHLSLFIQHFNFLK